MFDPYSTPLSNCIGPVLDPWCMQRGAADWGRDFDGRADSHPAAGGGGGGGGGSGGGGRRGFMVWIASNCAAGRVQFVAELMKHVPVDALGACLRNGEFPPVEPLLGSEKLPVP